MSFLDTINEEQEVIEEARVASLSGSIQAFSQINSYATSKEGDSIITRVDNMKGLVGHVEFNKAERKVYFMNQRNQVIKIENMTGLPTKKKLDDYFVPELLRREGTPGDLFGGF